MLSFFPAATPLGLVHTPLFGRLPGVLAVFAHHRFANQSDGGRIIPSSLFARLANQYFGINEQSVTNKSFEIQDCRGDFTTNLSTRLVETSVILSLPWSRSACFGLAQLPFHCSGNLDFSGLLIAAASADNKPWFRESLCLFKHR